ncbi:hypothetical protein HELRODRAFT_162287 [Helobdella robusta]|uniref:C2 domain-containing protein n=1 Tax=Helobdella robusta TaxID=6412 RepID=T1ESG4_HELRO|nr:hypothetical protein HELRODRAFT_162287 [Helobdella robusta]ESN98828.1 hypothetical protein HELRODRAFT_162287 [Helobdella robusta]
MPNELGQVSFEVRNLNCTSDLWYNLGGGTACYLIEYRDEDDDLRSLIKSKFSSESDDFLGQVIIEACTLVGETELWYSLAVTASMSKSDEKYSTPAPQKIRLRSQIKKSDSYSATKKYLTSAKIFDSDRLQLRHSEKRTDRSAVSGAIRLKISVEIKGEEKVAPYHVQYNCLHENLFQYLLDNNGTYFRLPTPKKSDDWKVYFDARSQEIVDEFAMRYGIESIYQTMLQFSCLFPLCKKPNIAAVLNSLLTNIISFYAHNSSTNSITASDRLNSSNFGTTFSSQDEDRLEDLRSSIKLLISISNFRTKVQELSSPLKVSVIISDCVKACITSSYQHIFNNCIELYAKEFESDSTNADHGHNNSTQEQQQKQQQQTDEGPGCTKHLSFWMKLIMLMILTIDEDINVYSNVFDQFFDDLNVGNISAVTQWQLFCQDLKFLLEDHCKETHCATSDYVNLHNRVNSFYDKFIAVLPASSHFEWSSRNAKNNEIDGEVDENEDTSTMPSFPLWFEHFIQKWFKENDDASVALAKNAYLRDKKEKFPKASPPVLFSCSVTDVFTQLNQCYTVVSTLIKPHASTGLRYLMAFASTIENVLMSYSSNLKEDFPSFCNDNSISCRLMNNIQQLRIELEKIFLIMGGDKMKAQVVLFLNGVQQKLSSVLDQTIAIFCNRIIRLTSAQHFISLTPFVAEKVTEMSHLLAAVQGQGQILLSQPSQKNAIINESNKTLSPLIDYLDANLAIFAQLCEKTVLKRLLKALWRVVMRKLEVQIVLPPVQSNKQSFPELPVDLLSQIQQKQTKLVINLSEKQRMVLEMILDTLKQFFWANNNGLKKSFLQRDLSYQTLVNALFMYTQSTDILIKAFVESQSCQVPDRFPDDTPNENYGMLSMQLDFFTHPATGDHKITVKIVAVADIVWNQKSSNIFQPFLKLHMLGPNMATRRRVESTKVKSGLFPKFNESFTFFLDNECELEFYELHICLKDYCFAREDRLIGVSVYQLRDIVDQQRTNCSSWLCFKRSVYVDEIGYMILRVLSQRTNDQIAKEFFKLKTEVRYS